VPFFLCPVLDVSCSKINAKANLIIIITGIFFSDGFTFFFDLEQELQFMMDVFGEVRMVERIIVFQERSVRLKKNDRVFR
jgi:hypothetical protein